MALNDQDQARVREYLLGRLSDDDQQEIEERLMVEDQLFEELEISKGELIEEYRAGDLEPHEKSFFEGNFLATPEGRQRQLFTVALDCIANPVSTKSPSMLQRLQAFFGGSFLPVAATVIAAIAIVVIAGPWFQPLQRSLAVTLTNSSTRRASGEVIYEEVKVGSDVGEIRLSLIVPQPSVPVATYRVELDDRSNKSLLTPVSQDQNSVLVVIPAKQLLPGLYSLKLTAISPDNTEHKIPGDYLFEITS